MILEPYAVVQRWCLPVTAEIYESIIIEYFETLAKHFSVERNSVIGHIKAIAIFPNREFYCVSKVAVNIPAAAQGTIPTDYNEIDLTTNIVVYGLSKAEIEKIMHKTADEMAAHWKGTVYRIDGNTPSQVFG